MASLHLTLSQRGNLLMIQSFLVVSLMVCFDANGVIKLNELAQRSHGMIAKNGKISDYLGSDPTGH